MNCLLFVLSCLFSVIKWMHGLQCMAGLLILTLIAGALYRSASVYHPRRKDILYLKTHKKNRRERGAGKPPYLDFSALRMRSLQALMVIAAIMGIGVHVPFILLVSSVQNYNYDKSVTFIILEQKIISSLINLPLILIKQLQCLSYSSVTLPLAFINQSLCHYHSSTITLSLAFINKPLYR